tara:strand:+ start:415 stop:963 length:549 start_codon:yes stop_codon:yes gene_type:complete
MNEIQVVDEFIHPNDHEELQRMMQAKEFPWTVAAKTGDMDINSYGSNPLNTQMSHWFADYKIASFSPFFKYVLPIVNQQRIISISRIKANLQLCNDKPVKSDFHYDSYLIVGIKEVPEKTLTNIIYYVNTNNGYTEFEDGQIVESVANRAVIFPNTLKHRGVSQTDTHYRAVINLNLCLYKI